MIRSRKLVRISCHYKRTSTKHIIIKILCNTFAYRLPIPTKENSRVAYRFFREQIKIFFIFGGCTVSEMLLPQPRKSRIVQYRKNKMLIFSINGCERKLLCRSHIHNLQLTCTVFGYHMTINNNILHLKREYITIGI